MSLKIVGKITSPNQEPIPNATIKILSNYTTILAFVGMEKPINNYINGV